MDNLQKTLERIEDTLIDIDRRLRTVETVIAELRGRKSMLATMGQLSPAFSHSTYRKACSRVHLEAYLLIIFESHTMYIGNSVNLWTYSLFGYFLS